MLGTALYYPYIDIRDSGWLRSAILFWDEIQTIAPTSIHNPYQDPDTKICEREGYLRPLRCDLHPDLLEELGRRVFKLLESPEWAWQLSRGQPEDASRSALMHAAKLSHEIKWRMEEIVGIHPDKMPPALRSLFIQSGGLDMIAAEKLPPNLRRIMRNFEEFVLHPEKLSYSLRDLVRTRPHHADGDWILVNSRFAEVYMSALAALLAKEVHVSPLTNEEPSSGVNLRCLVEDVAAGGPTAAKGALVSVVMEGLQVDPGTPITHLLRFRKNRADQLAELSGIFDELKGRIEKSSSTDELEDAAKAIFENKISPGLKKLKRELKQQSIQSAWEGFQRAVTVSAPAGGVLAAATGFSGTMLLGVGAFITMADVGIKSYLARSKARASSPYTYLLDIERRFSLPS
ncbi:DUF6236 family protein [Bradyrhizobium guangzhouense]|uniref:DUF6236 family protein n=1 Tax=Bradyrhizobium guangzhouense TaxID=1325095 RepID=UPI001009F6E6|nr:DUF6236 family protein [Bradyrhizobium guangzhouense]